MPFRSKAQRRFLFATKPDVAREFASKTPEGIDLPERVSKKKRKPVRNVKSIRSN